MWLYKIPCFSDTCFLNKRDLTVSGEGGLMSLYKLCSNSTRPVRTVSNTKFTLVAVTLIP